MGQHSKKEKPTTGNGIDQGQKPKPSECAQRLKNGVKLIKQPDSKWAREPQPDTRIRNKWFR